MNTRREFIKTLGLVTGGVVLAPNLDVFAASKKSWFDISLAQWSLHRTLRKGDLDNLDFAAFARKEFDIHAVEYVNQFFKDKAQDFTYLKEMKKRAKDKVSWAMTMKQIDLKLSKIITNGWMQQNIWVVTLYESMRPVKGNPRR
jgi:hypothetical protein